MSEGKEAKDSKESTTKNDQEDKELAELLDSALEDFKKEDEVKKPTEEKKEPETKTEGTSQEWSNEFIQQTAGQFEENFAALFSGGDPNAQLTPELLQAKLQQMADAAQQVLADPAQVPENNDFAQSISQAIQGLSQGAEGLQNPFNENDLMRIFGPGGGTGQENDLLPFMQGMMQGLLSKEVLGPSLQDFVEKLPDYIERNRDTLARDDIERYENQKKLMEEVLEELNKEKEEDSAEMKKERFTKVLGLMQKLQDYGQPPAELVGGDVDSPFTFDALGNPMNMPNLDAANNPECSIM